MAKRVLVAVDGSPMSLAALRSAISIIGTDAEYVVAEAVDPIDRVRSMGHAAFNPEVVRDALERLRENAEAELADARSELEAAGVRDLKTVVLEGAAGEALVEYAVEGGFDLVALGTHGRSGPARTLLGSVADYVVRHLRGVPVLLTRSKDA